MPQFLNRVRTAALRLTGGSPGSDKVVVGDSQGEASWAKIVNANVDSSAGIAFSKMETGSPNQILRADATGIPNFEYLPVDTPIGTVLPYILPDAPYGYLKLDGSTVNRTAYPELFALLNNAGLVGTLFGSGDGSTTFTLPDYTGIGFVYIIKATYSTLMGDAHAESSEAFTVFMGS